MRLLAYTVGTSIIAVSCALVAQAQSTETYVYDALGRLIKVDSAGGNSDGMTRAICYDNAGNRIEYQVAQQSVPANCVSAPAPTPTPTTTPTPTPTPTQTPTPTPSNTPPQANTDFVSGECFGSTLVNVTSNDTDAEGNYPLVLNWVVVDEGQANGSIYSGNIVEIFFGPSGDFSLLSYGVSDSLGAQSTGTINVGTSSCGGGPPPN